MKIYSFDEFERNIVVDESISANYDALKVNEGLFGIGSPSKPAIAVTADYIREHTPEEIGQVFFDNAAYYMDKAKYEVDKAIDLMNEKMKDIWAEVKNSAEVAKKFADGIVYSVKAAISEKYNAVKKYAAALPNAILCGVCYLVNQEHIETCPGTCRHAVKNGFLMALVPVPEMDMSIGHSTFSSSRKLSFMKVPHWQAR